MGRPGKLVSLPCFRRIVIGNKHLRTKWLKQESNFINSIFKQIVFWFLLFDSNRKQGRRQRKMKESHKVFQGPFRSKYLIVPKKPRESCEIAHYVDKNFPIFIISSYSPLYIQAHFVFAELLFLIHFYSTSTPHQRLLKTFFIEDKK